MSKRIGIYLLSAAFAAVVLVATTGIAAASSAAPSKSPLIIAMKDPGCHWFYTGGKPDSRKYSIKAVRKGPVTLLNLDEAAMVIKGPGGTKIEKVGQKLTLKTKGTYHLTMVKQAPDDNHLVLVVK
jgi:hypothetical protein